MNEFKSGFVSVIGRPNVGKSTLLNKILGQKIVITTPTAQTTRKRVKGIFTNEQGQIVFIDTPGIHKPLDNLGKFLIDESKEAIENCDLIIFLVDGSEKSGRGDKWIVENFLKTIKIPVLVVLNKVDKIKDPLKQEQIVISYKLLFEKNMPLIKISALTGRNSDTLISNILKKLPKGELIYPKEQITDENLRFITQEIIREKILLNTKDEIPHCVDVIIEEYKEEKNIDKITASIVVEQDSQKGIIIGKKAQMLKKIGTQARIELEEIADKKIFLGLNVKVEKNWRNNRS